MNKVIISGNLVKDMEVKTVGKTVVGTIIIANNRGFGENQKTSFVRCSLFGESRVEGLEKYMVTGAKVLVEGVLDITSKEIDGDYVTFTNVIIDQLEILKFKEVEEEKPKKLKKTYGKK